MYICISFWTSKHRPPPPPIVNDNEQRPDNMVFERKDDILLWCKQIFNFFSAFWNIYLRASNFRENIVPKDAIFGPNFLPDVQCRFLLEVKQIPQ